MSVCGPIGARRPFVADRKVRITTCLWTRKCAALKATCQDCLEFDAISSPTKSHHYHRVKEGLGS
jgi:hypothetical protein